MPCHPPKTNADRSWPYIEYYFGERDEHNRKHGEGSHHWTGALSQESYTGSMLRDTMHGYGDYRWRHLGPNSIDTTYEGKFYNNKKHGYGTLSFPDGRVFYGLFFNDIRWGPGVESHPCLRENVGLWYGYQLVRLAWRPAAPSVAIDLITHPVGSSVITPHRTLLSTATKIIGEVNSALELLKQCGSEPLAAAENWMKLYPKHCTDGSSQLCHIESFDRAYYDKHINLLNEVAIMTDKGEEVKTEEISQESQDTEADIKTYYAWNNEKMIIHMMKHCFTHDHQINGNRIKLAKVLSGPRTAFKKAAKHELDCRTLLMASYLGHISNVVQLVNESDVIPDVMDIQGNSATMYAACGDQPEIINFLWEAGTDVDFSNDACCTPLGITLLRFALVKQDVAYSGMLQALLPPPTGPPPPQNEKILEWYISRVPTQSTDALQKSPSKTNNKTNMSKRTSLKEMPNLNKRKSGESATKSEGHKKPDLDKLFTENVELYNNINNEYIAQVTEAFSLPSEVNPIPYFFEVYDMNKDVELMTEEEQKKGTNTAAKKAVSKIIRDTSKPKHSRDMMYQSTDKADNILDAKEQMKLEKLARIMATIEQLLTVGADPRKVRCPQPALFIAAVAGSADLIRLLVKHGADINEVYPQAFDYTTLDVAISGPLTYDNLEVIRSLLESGANPNHRLKVHEPVVPVVEVPEVPLVDDGPTLLHAVLARRIDFDPEEEVRRQILELLLEYGCNPITQCKGHSAVELAMMKNMDLFDIFIKSPQTDLNAIINDSNQTILVKMFYLHYCKTIPLSDRLQMLTNLLLFGADPLLKCQNGKDEYGNLFVYVRKVLSEIETLRRIPSLSTGNPKKTKSDTKVSKKSDKKDANVNKLSTKPSGGLPKVPTRSGEDHVADYRQALELVVDCARLLYIRWLQAHLLKELIAIVYKFKHRPWTMIIKEHKNKKTAGLWLTAVRCLEIWDVLKTTNKKIYEDDKILKQVLCIIHIYYKRTRKILRCPDISAQEKALIEEEVANFIHEHKLAAMSSANVARPTRPYVTPELTVKDVEKFNVCFECALPLGDEKIPCSSCKLIAFCSFACMQKNIDRVNCHPCSSYLKTKYFPTPEETECD